MHPSDKVCQEPDYRLEMIDDELLLYHPGQTKILYCNQTASLVWGLCDGLRSVEEITKLLCEAFPEAADTIPSDVETALEQFYQHGAIRYVSEDGQTGPSSARKRSG